MLQTFPFRFTAPSEKAVVEAGLALHVSHVIARLALSQAPLKTLQSAKKAATLNWRFRLRLLTRSAVHQLLTKIQRCKLATPHLALLPPIALRGHGSQSPLAHGLHPVNRLEPQYRFLNVRCEQRQIQQLR